MRHGSEDRKDKRIYRGTIVPPREPRVKVGFLLSSRSNLRMDVHTLCFGSEAGTNFDRSREDANNELRKRALY